MSDIPSRPVVRPMAFLGTSPAVELIRDLIDKVKDLEAPVLITGESGTGKELIARAVHFSGGRGVRPFVAVNCGAIPDHLLESELFGYARGAFTGALRDKEGLIEAANGGTFFLDEIGDLSFPLQAKLLRLLQEREIRRVGENRTRLVDVRFISATNKSLEKEIGRGRFREDLYYRLRIITIDIPPLRERKDDLLLLLDHFAEKYAREMKKERVYFAPRSLDLFLEYGWPGNVRELQNEVQRCLILCGPDRVIREGHLSPKVNPRRETSRGVEGNFFDAKAEFVRRFLNQALARYDYNKARTAEEIGLSRQGLFKLIKKHKLDVAEPRRPFDGGRGGAGGDGS
jgi:transcriptional regulator with PAS, ATPase and Fis domain